MVGPTPLEEWSNLSKALGTRIMAKRDDVSVIGLGGNKVRKLDLILGQALQTGITDVVTVGGLQSNHCRLTAAACARLGLRSHVFLRGPDPHAERAGNLLLDELFGSAVHIHDTTTFDDLLPKMQELAAALETQGRKPMVVPLGGSTPLGTLSYVLAVRELRQQLDSDEGGGAASVDRVVVAAGTGGTLAGIALGCSAFLPHAVVVGVSVSRPADQLATALRDYRAEARGLVQDDVHLDNVELVDGYVGAGYTIPNQGTSKAVRLLAQSEGVLGDLTYTGKALEYLVDNPDMTGPRSGTTLFWHTGGAPELFARPTESLLDADSDVSI